jgi:hypothetical protein
VIGVDVDERPPSVTLALRLLVGLVLFGALTVLLVVLRQDDLITAWARGNPAVRELLETRGLDAVKSGSVQPPHFIPVAVTLYVVVASLLGVLGVFFGNGFEWARLGITVLLFFAGVAIVAGLRVGQPRLFDVFIILGLALFAALMVPLWHPDTTAYIHADPEAEAPAAGSAGTSARP